MPLIDKNLRSLRSDNILKQVEGKRIYIWGNSLRNTELFTLIPPSRITAIFDNNKFIWGSYSPDGIKIVKPFAVKDKDIIISTVGDPYGSLIFTLGNLTQNYYFFRTEIQFHLYEETELNLFNSSPNHFVPNRSDFKYLHFIEDEKFIRTLFFIFQKISDLKDHCFVVYDVNRTNHLDKYNIWHCYKRIDHDFNNIILFDGIFNTSSILNQREKKLCEVIENCQKVFIHGEYLTTSIQSILKSKIDCFKKKSLLIPWNPNFGRDYRIKSCADSLLKFCSYVLLPNFGKKRLIEIMRFFNFDEKTKFIRSKISYAFPIEKFSCINKNNTKKKIFVAHSCFDYNKIIESVSLLRKFLGEIDLYAVSSYGDIKYKEKVEQYLERYNINNFNFIDKFLSDQEYADLLNSMDCAVFSMTVGAGMTTLNILFYAGIKVFVPKDSDTYVYVTSRGYRCHDTNEIQNISFSKLIEKSEFIEHNRSVANDKVGLDGQSREWKKILHFDKYSSL